MVQPLPLRGVGERQAGAGDGEQPGQLVAARPVGAGLARPVAAVTAATRAFDDQLLAVLRDTGGVPASTLELRTGRGPHKPAG